MWCLWAGLGEGEMEPYHHGRRGKESLCGMNRAHQTLVFMLVMVATMACVLLWEASPFAGGWIVRSPILKSSNTLYAAPSKPSIRRLINRDYHEVVCRGALFSCLAVTLRLVDNL